MTLKFCTAVTGLMFTVGNGNDIEDSLHAQ